MPTLPYRIDTDVVFDGKIRFLAAHQSDQSFFVHLSYVHSILFPVVLAIRVLHSIDSIRCTERRFWPMVKATLSNMPSALHHHQLGCALFYVQNP